MKLAGGNCIVRTMRATIDIKAAHSADPFTAIVVKCHWFLILDNQLFIQDIEHLKERTIRGY
jgi:hypothetical protein